MKLILLGLMAVSFDNAIAAKIKGNIIDLGNLEIEGEVRRPMLKYISTKKEFEKVIEEALVLNFREIENELLKIDIKQLKEAHNNRNNYEGN